MPTQSTLDISSPDTPYYFEVAINRPLFQTYTYTSEQKISIGTRVKVTIGKSKEVGIITQQHPTPPEQNFKIRKIEETIDDCPTLSPNLVELLIWASNYYFQPIGEFIFTFLPKHLKQDNALSTLYQEQLTLSPTGKEFKLPSTAHKQAAAIELFNNNTQLSRQELKQANISYSVIKQLLQKDALVKKLAPPKATKPKNSQNPKKQANNEQQQAINEVIQSENNFQSFLLDGITGSGKTEVYLNICQHFLELDKQVLMLVPEIGLTPQLYERIQSSLDYPVITLHSDIANKERATRWLEAKHHQPQVVIGTRSAIICDLPNLGCIILDEEHDASFKQQEGVRYHARSIAIKRAQLQNIPVLLGTATPALESLNNTQQGSFKHLKLSQRANKAQLPSIHIENAQHLTADQIFTSDTLKSIQSTLASGHQALIFINRRGFSPSLQCKQCHWVAECQDCDVTMTVHKATNSLECHHCDAKTAIPSLCPRCNSPYLAPMGFGTERIEEQLTEHFPQTTIIRIDRDSTQNKGSLERIRNQINENTPLIIIGTQMVTKGHDFPNLTLTVVVNTDNGLYSQDFRAKETLMQNLIQVSGRSGRGENKGSVVVQTNYPEHPVFEHLKQHDYQTFAKEELTHRKELKLPPIHHCALIRMQSFDTNQAYNKLKQLELQLNQLRKQPEFLDLEITATSPSLIEKKSNWYRYMIMVSSPNRRLLHQALNYARHFLKQTPRTKKIKWVIDVDPLDTL